MIALKIHFVRLFSFKCFSDPHETGLWFEIHLQTIQTSSRNSYKPIHLPPTHVYGCHLVFFVSGFLVDRTHNYGSAFYSCAAGMGVGALFLGLVRPAKSGLCLGRRRNEQQTTDRDSSSQGSDEGPADFVEMDMEIDNSPAKSKPWPVWIPPHLKSKHTYPPLEGSSQRLPYTNPVQTG